MDDSASSRSAAEVRRLLDAYPRLKRAARQANRLRETGDRYVRSILPRETVGRALRNCPRFLRDRWTYQTMSGGRLHWYDDHPQLLDLTRTTPFDRHYTYQDAWAARQIFAQQPASHVDVGSRISFVIGLAAFVPVTFIDLRPLEVAIPGMESRRGSILDLPYEDATVESLSCLHVAEHIGLGRYGDRLDPQGTAKAALELQRVLSVGGTLYFSVPVGRPHTAFNAHRVLDPLEVAALFPELHLAAFAGVDDSGVFSDELDPADLAGSGWGCGLYTFERA